MIGQQHNAPDAKGRGFFEESGIWGGSGDTLLNYRLNSAVGRNGWRAAINI